MKKAIVFILTAAAILTLAACGKGNSLWDDAHPRTSILIFYITDEDGTEPLFTADNSVKNEILSKLKSVKAVKDTKWSPEKATMPIYSIEIGTTGGHTLCASWSGGYLITQDGAAYKYDFDFTSLESYDWTALTGGFQYDRTSIPCARYFACDGEKWYPFYLRPVEDFSRQKDIEMEITAFSDSGLPVSVSLTNTGGKLWQYGMGTAVQVCLDGTWYVVPGIPGKEYSVNTVLFGLRAGETAELNCAPADYYGNLPPGNYRITAGDDTHVVCAEFEIE